MEKHKELSQNLEMRVRRTLYSKGNLLLQLKLEKLRKKAHRLKERRLPLTGGSFSLHQLINRCVFFPPKPTNGTSIVTPPSGVFEEGELLWKNAVVAQFVGRIPNFSVFQKMVNILWGDDGEIDIRPTGHNLFVLQFPNSQTRDRVIESGPWHIQNKPLIVRRWEPGMRSLEFNMAKLPLWIHLSNIPLELFTQTRISYIASAVGNPLYMDRFTASQQRLAFAKVCIKVESAKEIPHTMEVQLRDGSLVSIHVEVPWKPMRCLQCNIFGHGDKTCPRKVQTVKAWVPTAKKIEDPTVKDKVEMQPQAASSQGSEAGSWLEKKT